MTHTTILLSGGWDLTLDDSGNIATTDGAYGVAQDVASALRTFLGECWYDTAQGLPYWQQILGQFPPLAFVRQKLIDVAKSVSDVAGVTVEIIEFSARVLRGRITVTTSFGNTFTLGLG